MASLENVVDRDFEGSARLDVYVSECLGAIGRSRLKARLKTATVNGKNVKLSCRIKAGDRISLDWEDEKPLSLTAEDIPLKILYEDERILVIDKQQGLLVHPGAGNPSGTVVNALLWQLEKRGKSSCLSLSAGRPGIVHRLDKDTSGVLLCALDDDALAYLSNEFKMRRVKKHYLALVQGCPPQRSGRIETLLTRDPKDRKKFAVSQSGGKEARSSWRVLASWGSHSLLLMGLETGRTHQLRVHLRHIGCPILGDPIYGTRDKRFPSVSLMLHARRLGIRLPSSTVQASSARAKGVVSPLSPGTWKVFTARIPRRLKLILRDLDRHPGRSCPL